MNFKKIGLSAAIAAAMIGGGIAATAPAEAATITKGSVLALKNNNNGGFQETMPSGDLKFNFFGARSPGINPALNNQGLRNNGSTGSFLGTNTSPITRIQDLVLAKTLNPTQFKSGTVPNFLTGIDIAGNSNFKFDLDFFTFDAVTGKGRFKGTFSDGVVGLGNFNKLAPIAGPGTNFAYNLDITAVPTPALLPGLIGMGVAALRKRKGEASEAETAEVKA